MSSLFKLGGMILLISFAAWFYEDTYGNLPLSNDLDYYLALIGAGVIVLSVFVAIMMKASGTSWKLKRKNRCTRCGRKVKRGELYCEFHQNEVQAEYLSGLSDESKARRQPSTRE